MDKITKQILINARKLIEIGWTQHTSHEVIDGVHCYCVSGAICRAAWDSCYAIATSNARLKFEKIINENIPLWNDKPERTKEEVLAAFDKAIES